MVRMRPCAEGAQAPHWLPLCSCFCCHCSCAVSGQSHNTSSFSFINHFHYLILNLTVFALLLLMFLFCLTFSLLLFLHLTVSDLFHYFVFFFPILIFLTCHSFLCSTTICLHLPSNPPSVLVSVSRQHFLRLTWLWTTSHALCIFPHLSFSVSGNKLQCLSLLTSDYWCSQTLVKTDHSHLICIFSLISLQMLSIQRVRVSDQFWLYIMAKGLPVKYKNDILKLFYIFWPLVWSLYRWLLAKPHPLQTLSCKLVKLAVVT